MRERVLHTMLQLDVQTIVSSLENIEAVNGGNDDNVGGDDNWRETMEREITSLQYVPPPLGADVEYDRFGDFCRRTISTDVFRYSYCIGDNQSQELYNKDLILKYSQNILIPCMKVVVDTRITWTLEETKARFYCLIERQIVTCEEDFISSHSVWEVDMDQTFKLEEGKNKYSPLHVAHEEIDELMKVLWKCLGVASLASSNENQDGGDNLALTQDSALNVAARLFSFWSDEGLRLALSKCHEILLRKINMVDEWSDNQKYQSKLWVHMLQGIVDLTPIYGLDPRCFKFLKFHVCSNESNISVAQTLLEKLLEAVVVRTIAKFDIVISDHSIFSETMRTFLDFDLEQIVYKNGSPLLKETSLFPSKLLSLWCTRFSRVTNEHGVMSMLWVGGGAGEEAILVASMCNLLNIPYFIYILEPDTCTRDALRRNVALFDLSRNVKVSSVDVMSLSGSDMANLKLSCIYSTAAVSAC